MFKKTVIDTFDSVFKNSNNLIEKIFIPTLIITFINYLIPNLSTNFELQTINIFALFILMMCNISIAITVHRVIILGKDSVPKFGSYIFQKREFLFLLKSILLGIIILIPTILLSFIPFIGIFIAVILAILMISRLSIIFPAIACDKNLGFYEAWIKTKNYKLLTIFSVILFPFLFSLSVGIVYTFAIEFLIKIVSEELIFLYSFLNVFILVFTLSALSATYSIIIPKPLNETKKNKEVSKNEIIETFTNDLQKIIIDDRYDISFETLKKRLNKYYKSLGFTLVAYDRESAYIVRNPEILEAFISLRYDNNQYIVEIKKSNKIDPHSLVEK